MKILVSVLLISACCCLLPGLLTAQEDTSATTSASEDYTSARKHENVKWYAVEYYKFKPGQMEQAMKIANEHFMNVDKKVGMKTTLYTYPFGEWDIMVMFPMEGPDELAYKLSPSDARWNAAFFEQVGGQEKAMKVFGQFMETIAESRSEIVMQQMDEQDVAASAQGQQEEEPMQQQEEQQQEAPQNQPQQQQDENK